MKHFFLTILTAIFFVGCGREFKPEELSGINGYWEIEKVKLPDGEYKDYKVNETIDYFKLDGKTGFRKKVMPQLDGKYLENGHAEQIKVVVADGKTYLNYTTECCTWKEEIIEITPEIFVLKNASNLEYHYKKPMPFSIK